MVDTIKEIELILAGYFDPSGDGGQDINGLLDMQDRLAIHSYRLAEITGNYKEDYNAAYFIRKITVSKRTQGIISSKKTSKAQAEIEANNESEQLILDELDKEADAYRSDLLLRQVNKVLSAMQQRISYLKIELEKTKA